MSAKILSLPSRREVTLTDEERDRILLAADEMIARGGPDLLVQVLAGMRSEQVLAGGFEELPSFALLRRFSPWEIERKVDAMLEEGWLRVECYGTRRLLVHSDAGWERIKPIWAERLVATLEVRASAREAPTDVYDDVGRVHREVKLLALDRIERDRKRRLKPVLESWREREGRGMKRRIGEVLETIDEAPDRCGSRSSSPP